MPDIVIVPASRELIVDDARWITGDPAGEAIRDVVENLGETEYRIDVTADGARLTTGCENALRHAESTYAQLLDAAEQAGDGRVAVPAVRIAEAPRFGWRGMMLDVAQHFMPKERSSAGHWPPACRAGRKTSPTTAGGTAGFYTKSDLREIVAYAAGRGSNTATGITGQWSARKYSDKGHDLACTCPLDGLPCHRDVLLARAAHCPPG